MPLPGEKQSDERSLMAIEDFGSINTKALRPAIDDKEMFFCENFFPLGHQNLRTMYGQGPTLYTAPTGLKMIYRYNFILAGTDYWAVFLSDGTAVQVNSVTGAITSISSVAGTFYNGGDLPACAQFQNKYLAIVSTVTVNSYWLWDGTELYTAGTLSPDSTVVNSGKNYTGTPTVTISGGSGSGATATAVVKNQAVTSLTITNPGSGYQLGDLPVATISGGGTDSGASGTAVIDTTSGAVSGVIVLAGGTGYTTASVITFAGGGGTGAQAVITGLTNGSITAITVTNGGFGYSSPPVLTISVGSNAQTYAEITSGGIVGVNLTSGGSGYIEPPTVTITGDGSGATAIANMQNSSIVKVNITAGGAGYTSSPTVAFSGGGGTGAAATAIISGGVVTYIVITNPGASYTSAPSVTLSGGGGTGAAATAVLGSGGGAVQSVIITNQGSGYTHASVTFSGGNNSASVTIDIFPFGFSGTTIETYQNRVWIGNGINIYASAPNTTGEFAASAGGVVTTVTDSTLRQKITRLAQSSGSLYQFGDSNIAAFTNVIVGTGGATTYSVDNIDPQIGTPWPNSVAAFGRALVFANPTGVYALFGGAAQKVSDQLDGLFETASFNTGAMGVTPTAAVGVIFQTKVYILTFTTVTPNTDTLRTIQAIWDGQRWFLGSQESVTQFMATQEVSSQLTAWGDDGVNLYPMFTVPSDTLTKTFSSKLFGNPAKYLQALRFYVLAQVNQTALPKPYMTISVDTETGTGTGVQNQPTGQLIAFYGTDRIIFDSSSGEPLQFFSVISGVPSLYGYSVSNYGRLMGLTVTTTTGDMTLMSASLLVRDYAPYG